MSRRVTRQGRAGSRGQSIVLLALAFMMLIGFAALALDGGHDYLMKRDVQNAADSAALAAGKMLAASGQRLSGPPLSSNDSAAQAGNQFAGNNGFATVRNLTCDNPAGTPANHFTTTWFDVAGLSCSATSGFTNRVVVQVPPVVTNGVAVPPDCVGTYQYNCLQITVTHRTANMMAGVLGTPTTSVSASAVVFGQPPSSGFLTPPAIAAQLYEPASGFTTTSKPQRAALSCSGGNCPTFWVTQGTQATLQGVDGGNLYGNIDTVALQSSGHMVVQGTSTICDTYTSAPGSPPAACPGSLGTLGFALNTPSSALYCSSLRGTATPAPCTTAGPGGATLAQLTGNETAFTPYSWTQGDPVVPSVDCGDLILNGGTVIAAEGNSACDPPANEPYTVLPGRYRSIVVNHGTYDFAPGLFYIYGTAPVNTRTGSCGDASGYTANGIDHCREAAADFDLCSANAGNGSPTSCSTLTAGVWIGYGGGSSGTYSTGSTTSCAGGAAGTSGGGGDSTIVTGTGVSFYFAPITGKPTANGFVSTNEVTSINLTAPGLGALGDVHDMPMLFDLQSSGFIHLDAGNTVASKSGEDDGGGGSGATAAPSGFTGIAYQNPSVTGGGVEIDPSLSGGVTGSPGALTGQVLAYSLTFFGGGTGIGVDFSNGYGSSSIPQVTTSGQNESQIIGTPSPSVTGTGNGLETFTLNYTDEWALDAYDVYIKVNGGSPVFFSQGIWSSAPAANTSLPPAANNPGDNTPARPNYTAARSGSVVGGNGTYTTALDPATRIWDDWTMTYADHSKMEISGQWTWGHERDITNAVSQTNTAAIRYTFPVPTGASVLIQMFMTDGDRCGDYATASYTFNNIGAPAGGQQSAGSVLLEE
jgi:Flp pilus assembly protein TadG